MKNAAKSEDDARGASGQKGQCTQEKMKTRDEVEDRGTAAATEA